MNKLLKVTLITAIMATSGMCGGYCDKPECQHQYTQQLANTQYVPNCLPCMVLTGGALAIGGVLIYKYAGGSCQDCCSGGDADKEAPITLADDNLQLLLNVGSTTTGNYAAMPATSFVSSTDDSYSITYDGENALQGTGQFNPSEGIAIGIATTGDTAMTNDNRASITSLTFYKFVVTTIGTMPPTLTLTSRSTDEIGDGNLLGKTNYLMSLWADIGKVKEEAQS